MLPSMRAHRFLITLALASAGAAAVALPSQAASPTASAAATRQYEGTIVSVNSAARTFRLRDSERGTVRIRVTNNTRFERIAGFGALKAGMTSIEATVRRSNGRWVALEVERSGGGGNHGGGHG
jgi:hypothetical protein